MSKEDFAKSILARRLVISRDWLGDLLGLVPYFIFWGMPAFPLYFDKESTNSKILLLSALFISLGAVFFYGIYCLIHEHDLAVWETGLSRAKNRERVLLALRNLDWKIIENHPQEIKAAVSRNWYGFVQQTATILIIDDILFLNVIHQGTHKGRAPFSFGQNEKQLTLLTDAIQAL